MPNFWNVVNRVIRDADVLIVVLDARMPSKTRNIELEQKIIYAKKPLIYVINKSDLANRITLQAYKKIIPNSVFISAKNHQGTQLLREKIGISAARAEIKGEIKVGVLGYPNVGKSSIINALSGRHTASISNLSGHTRGLKKVRASAKIVLLDTPGVIPYLEKDMMKHAMIGTIDYGKEKDPDMVVVHLMTEFSGLLEKYYGVGIDDDKYLTLEAIAKKRKLLSRGGGPDITRASRMILRDWQTGKIVM